MTTRLLIAAFLLAHGLIHGSFVAPRPPVTAGGPTWPFELGSSWILRPLGLDPETIRLVGSGLTTWTIGAFAVAALAGIGILPGLWSASVTIGAIGSLAVLALYFSPWFVAGLAIDLVLLWAVLGQSWAPDGIMS